MNELVDCPYCGEPVAGETVTLWDDRVYCRECVEKVSPKLYEFVIRGGRLVDEIKKSDLSLMNQFKRQGWVYLMYFFLFSSTICVMVGNAGLEGVISFMLLFNGIGVVYTFLRAVVEVGAERKLLPRRVSVENCKLNVVTSKGKQSIPLTDCEWNFGITLEEEVILGTSLSHGITIYTPEASICCCHSPGMLHHWCAFLVLAGVTRHAPQKFQVFTTIVTGICAGYLVGRGLGRIASIMLNDPRWVYVIAIVGVIEGLVISGMYAARNHPSHKKIYKAMHPAVWGLSFFVLGLKVGRPAGMDVALIYASLNSVIGVLAAWFCRSQIPDRDIEFEFEDQAVADRESVLIEEASAGERK